MKTVTINIATLGNGLGNITFGGAQLSFTPNVGYTGTIIIPDLNNWLPMYFSGSSKGNYIWLNFNNTGGSRCVGAICFGDMNGTFSPIFPTAINVTSTAMTMQAEGGLPFNNIMWNEVMQSPPPPPPPLQPVALQSAINQTLNWRKFLDSQSIINDIYAMYIPLTDINNVINPPFNPASDNPVGGIRLYFAINEPPGSDVAPTTAIQDLHLYVVAVDTNGTDIISTQTANSLIYDTTMPCPPMCAVSNLLNPDSPCCAPAFNQTALTNLVLGGTFPAGSLLSFPAASVSGNVVISLMNIVPGFMPVNVGEDVTFNFSTPQTVPLNISSVMVPSTLSFSGTINGSLITPASGVNVSQFLPGMQLIWPGQTTPVTITQVEQGANLIVISPVASSNGPVTISVTGTFILQASYTFTDANMDAIEVSVLSDQFVPASVNTIVGSTSWEEVYVIETAR